jgi:hypothetical protein
MIEFAILYNCVIMSYIFHHHNTVELRFAVHVVVYLSTEMNMEHSTVSL